MNIILTKLADILNSTDINVPKGTPDSVLSTILKIVFAVASAVSLLIITISGLRLVLSIGNPEALNKTRNTIIYAALGLIVCLSGFTIVTFVLNRI